MSDDLPSRVIAEIAFVGRTGGLVKALSGFRKPHHTVPDAANAVTNAFLAKICAPELGAEAEALFQAVRTAFGYKRKEIALELNSPLALLNAKDFVVEIGYALEPEQPARYAVTTILRNLQDAVLAHSDPMAAVFAGRFAEISFALSKPVQVAAVIDVIEAAASESLSVSYPSDCRECDIAVAGVDARIRCTPAALEIVFARASSPRELIAAFAEVRAAFRIDPVLAAITG